MVILGDMRHLIAHVRLARIQMELPKLVEPVRGAPTRVQPLFFSFPSLWLPCGNLSGLANLKGSNVNWGTLPSWPGVPPHL